jgi:transposase
MTYSIDFRRKVLKVRYTESLSFACVARRFDVGLATVVRWAKKIDLQVRRNKPATKINMEALRQDVEEYPDAYQYERAERLNVSKSCVFFALKRLGVTYKKNSQTPESEQRPTAIIS